MKSTVRSPHGQKDFVPTLATRGKAVFFWQRFTSLVLIIVLSSVLLTYGGCASFSEQSKIALPPKERLDRYLQTADHLTEKQKKDLARRRPFVGMTLEEANLAMNQESVDSALSGKAFRAVYVGDAGVKYWLQLGTPPRVANWSQFSRDDIELMDPDKLRPSPPGL